MAYLSSHEGFTKPRHFWFQYQVRHMSVGTIIQLFMASLTASKLRRQFWSSKRQRARASDFPSNLKTTGSVTIFSQNSCKIHWGFLYTKMHGVHRFKKFLISSLDISLGEVLMVFALILYSTRNDLSMLFSRCNEKSSIFLGKELYWS